MTAGETQVALIPVKRLGEEMRLVGLCGFGAGVWELREFEESGIQGLAFRV